VFVELAGRISQNRTGGGPAARPRPSPTSMTLSASWSSLQTRADIGPCRRFSARRWWKPISKAARAST